MPKPRILILRAPGTNCDVETAFAFERAGGSPETVHIGALLESPRLAHEFQIFCIPGGFSYGDDIAAGRIVANQLRHRLTDALAELKSQGKLILGICNGFQILLKADVLLTPGRDGLPAATLTINGSRKFEDRWVRLRTQRSPCVFFSGIQEMYLPVAHAEGRFVTRDVATLAALEAGGHVALRYASPLASDDEVPYPDNPNQSMAAIAGVCDTTGRVCGLMPHPERHIERTQHPHWTREPSPLEQGDGLRVFQNAVRYFA